MSGSSAGARPGRRRQPAPQRVVIPCSLRVAQAAALRALSRRTDLPCSALIRYALSGVNLEQVPKGL